VVRNAYNISRLRQRIEDALPRPLSVHGAAAVEGFLALTGISRWQPERLGVLQLSFVFDIGLPLGLIGDSASARALATSVGDAVCEGRRPDPQLWRVVHAAALLRYWGAGVEFNGEGVGRAAQLAITLPNGAALEVDVSATYPGGTSEADAPRLKMIDVGGAADRHAEIAVTCADDFAASPQSAGVVSFEPRFWVSVEQKEWIYRACVNPQAGPALEGAPFDGVDSGRRAIRLELLEPAA
jgi:hypothetical protein